MTDNKLIIAVIGLGYVGIQVAVAFAKVYKVIGYDINHSHIESLKAGHDNNNEIDDSLLQSVKIHYTHDINDLKKANFFIIIVPTPVDNHRIPDLSYLKNATTLVGKTIKKGDIIVYESTVYPGATEDICIPLLEQHSHLKCGTDFYVGYSPERVNPGDKDHLITNTCKIVSGKGSLALNKIIKVYSPVIKGGLHIAPSIPVAEAAKLLENTQRDIDIALMNEMAIILNNIGINSKEVFDAARTKWNFPKNSPGFVGGHCIGVSSLLMAYKSEEANYVPNFIYTARNVNVLMPKFIARETIKRLIESNIKVKDSKIGVFGITYKEDWHDCRDTKVIIMIEELTKFGVEIIVHDPLADAKAVKRLYKIDLFNWNDIPKLDAIIVAVGHKFYRELPVSHILDKLRSPKLIVDVKSILNEKNYQNKDIMLWQI